MSPLTPLTSGSVGIPLTMTFTYDSEDSLATFQEMFLHGSPRFISPNPPPYELEADDALQAYAALPDASAHQLSLFLSSVQPQLTTSTLRSFLRLYTTLGTDKLANFLNVSEEEVLEMLMVAKGAARKLTWVEGSLLEGETVGVSDINFGIDEGHLTVAQSTTSRRYGDFFLRHGNKWIDVYDNLKSKPLPLPAKAPNANGNASAAPAPASMASGGQQASVATGASGKPAWGKA